MATGMGDQRVSFELRDVRVRAIATANKNQINGVAVGTTNHNAQSIPMYWGHLEYANPCPLSQQEPVAPTNVNPTVSISGKNYVPLLAAGANGPNSTSLTATGVPAGGTYAWSITSGSGVVSLSSTGQPESTMS
jgi:hypothetical protein